ncbi:Aste57867_9601 [Aphanomyces stellatus]|uniref:Aste57867_9601 protein n=1 Tax=Aphanomyces stellatus TaxID=120398 RepID=A0A485KNR3_9STRA|nr:hypothetical protein As57867_009563 [Aphanomyces stellatus]VFT86480.1 Aste57867_9601 [Aphanomyces stellatus]
MVAVPPGRLAWLLREKFVWWPVFVVDRTKPLPPTLFYHDHDISAMQNAGTNDNKNVRVVYLFGSHKINVVASSQLRLWGDIMHDAFLAGHPPARRPPSDKNELDAAVSEHTFMVRTATSRMRPTILTDVAPSATTALAFTVHNPTSGGVMAGRPFHRQSNLIRMKRRRSSDGAWPSANVLFPGRMDPAPQPPTWISKQRKRVVTFRQDDANAVLDDDDDVDPWDSHLDDVPTTTHVCLDATKPDGIDVAWDTQGMQANTTEHCQHPSVLTKVATRPSVVVKEEGKADEIGVIDAVVDHNDAEAKPPPDAFCPPPAVAASRSTVGKFEKREQLYTRANRTHFHGCHVVGCDESGILWIEMDDDGANFSVAEHQLYAETEFRAIEAAAAVAAAWPPPNPRGSSAAL